MLKINIHLSTKKASMTESFASFRIPTKLGKFKAMCNSFTITVSKRHNRLAEVVGSMHGKTVKKAIIDAAWKSAFPALANDTQWIILSDHCINHTNKGACKCAKTELALFERVGRGEYRVL